MRWFNMNQDKQFFEAIRKSQMNQPPNQQQLFLIELIEKYTNAKFFGSNSYVAHQFIQRNWNRFKNACESDVTFNSNTIQGNVILTPQHDTEQDITISFRGKIFKYANKTEQFFIKGWK